MKNFVHNKNKFQTTIIINFKTVVQLGTRGLIVVRKGGIFRKRLNKRENCTDLISFLK